MSLDVQMVLEKYPGAYCCADLFGVYIVTPEKVIVGKGRRPKKAWENALKIILQTNKKRGHSSKP